MNLFLFSLIINYSLVIELKKCIQKESRYSERIDKMNAKIHSLNSQNENTLQSIKKMKVKIEDLKKGNLNYY